MLDIIQMQYYKQVVDSKNVQIAAEKLYISRQALAKQLHNIEDELGVSLIEVNHGVVSPTTAGQKLYDEASKLLNAYHKFERNIDSIKNSSIEIGYSHGVRLVMNKSTIPNFKREYPDVRLELEENSTDEIINEVEKEVLDLAIVGTCSDYVKDFDYELLEKTPLYIQVPIGFKEIEKGYITMEDLVHIPLVTAGKHNHLQQYIENECAKLNANLNIVFSATSTEILINFAISEKVAFLSFEKPISQELDGFRLLPIICDKDPAFGLYMIRKSDIHHSKNSEILWRYLQTAN